jgi:Lon-like ATP-dependent protease
MEVLAVSGYVSEEESVIANKYLGPQEREALGLKDTDVLLESATVNVVTNAIRNGSLQRLTKC